MGDTGDLATVGFRHVIEDGLSVLANRELSEDRKQFVLEDLAGLFREAKKGSELVQNQALFIRSADESAYKSFSLLERFWSPADKSEWIKMLEASENVFQSLRDNDPVSREAREVTEQFLASLLASLQRESDPGIPNLPEEIELVT